MRKLGSFAYWLLVLGALVATTPTRTERAPETQAAAQDGDWPAYGRDPGGERFSPLDAIRRENVSTLQVAWTFRTGDAYEPKSGRPTAFEATPLHVDGTLYLSTPVGRVIALDPVDGRQRWAFDARVPRDKGYGDFASRGVSTWRRGERRIRATPMTYLGRDGRQYVVISAGGHGTPLGPPLGDYLVAFALPK
jgi:glucose dehydrogenase